MPEHEPSHGQREHAADANHRQAHVRMEQTAMKQAQDGDGRIIHGARIRFIGRRIPRPVRLSQRGEGEAVGQVVDGDRQENHPANASTRTPT